MARLVHLPNLIVLQIFPTTFGVPLLGRKGSTVFASGRFHRGQQVHVPTHILFFCIPAFLLFLGDMRGKVDAKDIVLKFLAHPRRHGGDLRL